jgi:hypothetical protein
MNNKTSNNSATESELEQSGARFNAAEFASDLIAESNEWIAVLLKHDERISEVSKHPELVAVHALLSLLDFEGGRIAAALEEIAESVDFIAARPGDDEMPTEQERVVIYCALGSQYLQQYWNSFDSIGIYEIKEIDTALRRFKKLAGL